MKRFSTTWRSVVLTGLLTFPFPAVQAQGLALFAVLVGGNEVSATGAANAGDQDGFGTFTMTVHPTRLDPNNELLCFGLTVRAIGTPRAAHIHAAKAGVNGNVVVTLAPLPGLGNPGTSSGCVPAANSTVAALTSRPANFYVNVHTDAFPGGAIRGQLF